MSLWRQLTRGLSVLTQRSKADRDIADEVEHYFHEAAADLERSGLTAEEARRRARKELGSQARVREEVRSFGWENAVAATLSDLRYAARRLRQSPGFTAVGAFTLALGIGASAAIFSAVFPVLFESLPYPHPDRVVMVWESDGRYPSFGTFRGLAQRSRSFEALAAISGWQPALIGSGEPQRLQGQRVTAEYFRALGVPPVLGRDFAPSDDVPQAPRVVILSDALWRGRFAADRAILGRPVMLDDDAYTVIGVMPPRLENVLEPGARLWTSLRYDPSLPADGREWGHHLRMVGRLKAGVGPERASSELSAIVPVLARLYPRGYENSGGAPRAMAVTPLRTDLARAARPALLAILGAVSLLLVIACVNVTNLLLARGAQRRGEMAVRLALGAGRGRLVRQLLAEGVLLSALGAVPGVAMAILGVRALVALAPRDMPRAEAIGLDPTVVIFALAVTAAVGLAVGIIPALQGSSSLPADLVASSRRSAGGHQRTRRVLVVSEVALALVLLISAGLLLRSLQHLFAVAPGFNPSGVLTMEVQASGHRFDQAAAGNRFFTDALEAARAVPGVAAAGFTSQLPLSGDYDSYGTLFEKDAGGRGGPVFRYMVSPGYCETLGIPLLRGRLLQSRDDLPASPGAVLISESLSRKEFGPRDPLGQRLRIGPEDAPWFTIVGVVGDVKQLSLAIDDAAAVYVTPAHWPWPDRARSLVVRAQGDTAVLDGPIRKAIWSVDKDQPIVRIATMETLLAASAAERRFAFVLFQIFALAALGLAAIGIYGVLAGGVVERAREIGVRAALGASRGSILALVTRQGLALTGLGVGIGLVGAVLASRALTTLLFGVTRLDPATYLGVIAVLLAVAGIACLLPAWRAARIDPAITLRAE